MNVGDYPVAQWGFLLLLFFFLLFDTHPEEAGYPVPDGPVLSGQRSSDQLFLPPSANQILSTSYANNDEKNLVPVPLFPLPHVVILPE